MEHVEAAEAASSDLTPVSAQRGSLIDEEDFRPKSNCQH